VGNDHQQPGGGRRGRFSDLVGGLSL
jgi:hypothetical protein